MLAEAEHMTVPMPTASLVHDRLVATIARGWADLDWSVLGLLAASEAGLSEVKKAATSLHNMIESMMKQMDET